MKLLSLLKESVFDQPEIEKVWNDFKSLPEAAKEQVFLKVLVHAKNTQKIAVEDLKNFIKQPVVGAYGTRKGEQPFGGTGHYGRKTEDLSQKKAKTILRHGEVGGHKLSDKQRRFMGAMASGEKPR